MEFLPMTFCVLGGLMMITDTVPAWLGWVLIAVGLLFTAGCTLRKRVSRGEPQAAKATTAPAEHARSDERDASVPLIKRVVHKSGQ